MEVTKKLFHVASGDLNQVVEVRDPIVAVLEAARKQSISCLGNICVLREMENKNDLIKGDNFKDDDLFFRGDLLIINPDKCKEIVVTEKNGNIFKLNPK